MCEKRENEKWTKKKSKPKQNADSCDRKYSHPFGLWPPPLSLSFATYEDIYKIDSCFPSLGEGLSSLHLVHVERRLRVVYTEWACAHQLCTTYSQIEKVNFSWVVCSLLHRDFSICPTQIRKLLFDSPHPLSLSFSPFLLAASRLVDVVCANRWYVRSKWMMGFKMKSVGIGMDDGRTRTWMCVKCMADRQARITHIQLTDSKSHEMRLNVNNTRAEHKMRESVCVYLFVSSCYMDVKWNVIIMREHVNNETRNAISSCWRVEYVETATHCDLHMKKVVADFIEICASKGIRWMLPGGGGDGDPFTHMHTSAQQGWNTGRRMENRTNEKWNASEMPLAMPFFVRGQFSDEQAPIYHTKRLRVYECTRISGNYTGNTYESTSNFSQ